MESQELESGYFYLGAGDSVISKDEERTEMDGTLPKIGVLKVSKC